MVAYIDSSVLISGLFREKEGVVNLKTYGQMYSSRLLQTECLRTLVRKVIEKQVTEDAYVRLKSMVTKAISGVALIQIDESILSLAESPFPVHLSTLDAIHLASALRLKESLEPDEEFLFLTYDEKLGKAAKVMGLGVLGV
jgi:predicted nucleic acid-binding protein